MRYKTNTVKYVDAITFKDFVSYGMANSDNIVDGMPWSFRYKGQSITHETDTHYLVITEFGETIDFTSEDVLIIERDGTYIHATPKYIFDKHYELVETDNSLITAESVSNKEANIMSIELSPNELNTVKITTLSSNK